MLLVTIWDKAGQPNPGCRSNNCTKIIRNQKIREAFCTESKRKLDIGRKRDYVLEKEMMKLHKEKKAEKIMKTEHM